jgi:GntR family transcriptional regulator, transcriptional repressor for pyruvate dehydrogenase complex
VATAQPAFEAIRKSKLSEQVAGRLEHLITKTLKPGDNLPPERRLVEMFQVSRSSIRDAIRRLELMGLVEPRQGAGTVVRDLSRHPSENSLADVLLRKRELVTELLDVRCILEPALAARAASRISADQIARLQEILDRQEAKIRNGESSIEEDWEFHYNIALATNNTVILKVLDVLMDLLRDTRERSLQQKGRPQKSLKGHRRILAAFKRQDATAAEVAMSRHLQDIGKIVLNQL